MSLTWVGDGQLLTQLELHNLATYNAEVARGFVHTEGRKRLMAELQKRFDKKPPMSITEMEYEQDAPYRLITGLKFAAIFTSPFWAYACYMAWRLFR